MGPNPQEFGAIWPRRRRRCNSSPSAKLLFVFYLLSLHAFFCLVHVSARPGPRGLSNLDCVNDGTLPSNGTLSCNPSTEQSPISGPTASTPPTDDSKPILVIVILLVALVLLVSFAIANLYLRHKRSHTVNPSSPENLEPEDGEVDPGTHDTTTPSFATAKDTSLNSITSSVPKQANGSNPDHLDHKRPRNKLWKLSILSNLRKGRLDSHAVSTPSTTPPGDMLTETVSLRRCDVKRATSNFAKKIGAGGFGPVYYGKLPGSGLKVAVKVQANNSRQGPREFATEVETLSRAKHPNLVSLIGYCEERERCMLVYEFLPGGTLQERLYGPRSNPPLDWGTRLKIALQAAKGLDYLHNECVPTIIHRDVKSNNILLTKYGDAKLTDFGLSKSLEELPLQCSVKGTSGYLDPEYFKSMRLTHKSDVYSFGIVLLELISAREPADTNLPHEQWKLSDWVRNHLVEGKLEAIVDKALEGNFKMQSMWLVAELAMTCVEPRSIHRPTISEVVLELEAVIADDTPGDTHRPSIAPSTPGSTPDSFRTASQGHSSSLSRSTPSGTPDSCRTTSSLGPH